MDATKQLRQEIITLAATAKMASRKLAQLPAETKNKILTAMADALMKEKEEIIF